MREAIEQFRAAIRTAGLEPPDVIEPGKLHRFSTNGKGDDDAGWCKLFPDGFGGVYGDFRTGLSEHWQAETDRVMTQAEREAFRQRCEQERREREAEERNLHEAAALKAAAILNAATGAPATHLYAVKKRVPLGSLVKRGPWPQRGWNDALLVPIYGVDGRVWSIEAINTGGEKDFLAGGKTAGGFHPFGKIRGAGRVLIGEGVANAAVGSEVDKSPAVAALCAGNLGAVVEAVRELSPTAEIAILADNDIKPDGTNPGLKAANEAARAVGGRVVIPELDGRKCDLWDVWNEHGIEAVRAAVASATTPVSGDHQLGPENEPPVNGANRVILVRGDDLHVEPIRWLWDGWLARGKLHMLAGAPGTGKSTIALTLAAVVTAGGRWPDGTTCIPGHVLVWSGEDDAADTLLPRLLAAGGDPRRFHIVSGTVDRNGTRPFDPAMDIPALLTAARGTPDCVLALVDPVVAAVLGDSHKNTEVRRALQPLVSFAAELDAVVLGISHFSKGTAGRDPVERVTGSVAFGALPRVVMATARVREADTERRIFCRAKSNIGPDTGGWDYRLDLAAVPGTPSLTAVRVWWSDALEGAARDLLAEAEVTSDPDGGTTAKAEAVGWLRDILKGGDSMDGKHLKKLASDSGIKERTLYRAAQAIGVKMLPGGFAKPRRWHLCAISAKHCHVCLSKKTGTHEESWQTWEKDDALTSEGNDELAEGSL